MCIDPPLVCCSGSRVLLQATHLILGVVAPSDGVPLTRRTRAARVGEDTYSQDRDTAKAIGHLEPCIWHCCIPLAWLAQRKCLLPGTQHPVGGGRAIVCGSSSSGRLSMARALHAIFVLTIQTLTPQIYPPLEKPPK